MKFQKEKITITFVQLSNNEKMKFLQQLKEEGLHFLLNQDGFKNWLKNIKRFSLFDIANLQEKINNEIQNKNLKTVYQKLLNSDLELHDLKLNKEYHELFTSESINKIPANCDLPFEIVNDYLKHETTKFMNKQNNLIDNLKKNMIVSSDIISDSLKSFLQQDQPFGFEIIQMEFVVYLTVNKEIFLKRNFTDLNANIKQIETITDQSFAIFATTNDIESILKMNNIDNYLNQDSHAINLENQEFFDMFNKTELLELQLNLHMK